MDLTMTNNKTNELPERPHGHTITNPTSVEKKSMEKCSQEDYLLRMLWLLRTSPADAKMCDYGSISLHSL